MFICSGSLGYAITILGSNSSSGSSDTSTGLFSSFVMHSSGITGSIGSDDFGMLKRLR